MDIDTPASMDQREEHGALVIVGSGPGVGSHVAARFARAGFQRVVLMSRNLARLRVDAVVVQSAAPTVQVDIVTVDLSNTNNVRRALIEVDRRINGLGIECVVYNASRATRTEVLSFSVEELQQDLHVRRCVTFTHARLFADITTLLAGLGNQHVHRRSVGLSATARARLPRKPQTLLPRYERLYLPGPFSRILQPLSLQGRTVQHGHQFLKSIQRPWPALRTHCSRREA